MMYWHYTDLLFQPCIVRSQINKHVCSYFPSYPMFFQL
uniref:Uncharacterized protein n=1 Tax=Anguilla anguilla TaxID=7936 RepID=A0A0E9VYW9_ANGAN